MAQVIFGTAYIPNESELPRYINWVNYYKKAFPDIPLHLFHDGPIDPKFANCLTTLGCNFHVLTPHLGRNILRGNGYFPGWKRSYSRALHELWNVGYETIIFLESDLYIRKPFINKFRNEYFTLPGFNTGWCKRHAFIETSLQVINDSNIALDLHALFKSDVVQESDLEAEFQIRNLHKSNIISIGERLEVEVDLMLQMKDQFEYFAQFHYTTWAKFLE